MNTNHDYFMDLVLEQAHKAVQQGGRPICSLIVKDGNIIGTGLNTAARDNDPSAHAEINAIRDACSKLRTLDLSGSTLYTPLESCPMCLSTILIANIKRLVMGARHARVGMTEHGGYTVESFLALTRRELEVVTGVREAECETMRVAWHRAHAPGR